jgi:hypothetical protein
MKFLKKLRLRFGERFLAREEIYMLQRFFKFLKEGHYKVGSLFVSRYFRR